MFRPALAAAVVGRSLFPEKAPPRRLVVRRLGAERDVVERAAAVFFHRWKGPIDCLTWEMSPHSTVALAYSGSHERRCAEKPAEAGAGRFSPAARGYSSKARRNR